VTAYDVDIEGSQREHARYKCEKCQHEGQAQWESEKGIDASLTVHLFDTADSWDLAYVLSGDADFVPAVRSLRRRGKIVAGAGFSDRSSALVRECYHYVELSSVFFKHDLLAHELFREDGVCHFWLDDDVRSAPDIVPGSEPARFRVWWNRRSDHVLSSARPSVAGAGGSNEEYYVVGLGASGPIDHSGRRERANALCASYVENVAMKDVTETDYRFTVSSTAWRGVERRLEHFASTIDGLQTEGNAVSWCSYMMSYAYDHDGGEWRPTTV
jgi:hypothetical protein